MSAVREYYRYSPIEKNSNMLKMKCIPEFEGPITMLVIAGGDEDYAHASKILTKKLANKEAIFLNNPEFVIYYPSPLITKDIQNLTLTKEECEGLLAIFERYGSRGGGACHNYFDIEVLPEIELLISYLEYNDKIFTDDD
jgi:hypothetical protein